MKRVFVIIFGFGFLVIQLGLAHADGVTDVVIDPVAGLTISTSGHYRLVSNVTLTADIVAVNINTSDVTLDLNGHTITASAASTLAGILSAQTRVAVMNGTVQNFGDQGVWLSGHNCRISQVTADSCNDTGGSAGLAVGNYGVIEKCIASNNTSESTGSTYGIYAGINCIITENIANNNDSPGPGAQSAYGIFTDDGCVVADNVVEGTTLTTGSGNSTGIFTGSRCIIRGNTSKNNDNLGSGLAVGINTGSYCLVQGNTAGEQDVSAATTGFAVGIYEGGAGKVLDNVCDNNDAAAAGNGSAYGIRGGGGTYFQGNHCEGQNAQGTGNAAGIFADNGGNFLSQNYCRNNTGGAYSHGIHVRSTGNTVTGNTCAANGTAGLYFVSATDNRADSNRLRQVTGIDLANGGVNPESLGAGDLANVTY